MLFSGLGFCRRIFLLSLVLLAHLSHADEHLLPATESVIKVVGGYGYSAPFHLGLSHIGFATKVYEAPVVSIKPDSEMPFVPSFLNVPSNNSGKSFAVSWSAVSTASRYTLQRQVDNGSWNTVQDSSATKNVQHGLPSGDWAFRVNACNDLGCSSYTLQQSVSVLLRPSFRGSPNSPSTDADGDFTVSWRNVLAASSYTLQRQLNGGPWHVIQHSPSVSKNETGLLNGSYSYSVNACNASGCSLYSGISTTEVLLTPVSPENLQSSTKSSDGGFGISWGAVATATGYVVQRQFNTDGWEQVAAIGVSEFSEQLLVDGLYRYRAKACNSSGCSAFSVEAMHSIVDSLSVGRGDSDDGRGRFVISGEARLSQTSSSDRK